MVLHAPESRTDQAPCQAITAINFRNGAGLRPPVFPDLPLAGGGGGARRRLASVRRARRDRRRWPADTMTMPDLDPPSDLDPVPILAAVARDPLLRVFL